MPYSDINSTPSAKSYPTIIQKTQEQPQRTNSIKESRAALDRVIGSAQSIIRIFDRDLSDEGHRSPARIQLFESLVLANRRNRIQIVVHEARNLDRDCPRLMALFRRHTDVFAIRCTINLARHETDALVIADEHSYWHRLHQDHSRVVFALSSDANTIPLLINHFNEVWESSEPAGSVSVLGL